MTTTSTLTERETDVVRLVAQGYTNEQIAVKFEIAVTTVKEHVGTAFAKVLPDDYPGLNRRVLLARWWWLKGE